MMWVFLLQRNDVIRYNIWFQINIDFELEHKGQLFALYEHSFLYKYAWKREASLAAICLELLQYKSKRFVGMQGAPICSCSTVLVHKIMFKSEV